MRQEQVLPSIAVLSKKFTKTIIVSLEKSEYTFIKTVQSSFRILQIKLNLVFYLPKGRRSHK